MSPVDLLASMICNGADARFCLELFALRYVVLLEYSRGTRRLMPVWLWSSYLGIHFRSFSLRFPVTHSKLLDSSCEFLICHSINSHIPTQCSKSPPNLLNAAITNTPESYQQPSSPSTSYPSHPSSHPSPPYSY